MPPPTAATCCGRRFSDREGDELHRNDTIQESLSLADRFGLAINFLCRINSSIWRLSGCWRLSAGWQSIWKSWRAAPKCGRLPAAGGRQGARSSLLPTRSPAFGGEYPYWTHKPV